MTTDSPTDADSLLEHLPESAVAALLLVLLGLWLGRWWIRRQGPAPTAGNDGPQFSVLMAAVLSHMVALLTLASLAPPMEVAEPVARLRLALRLSMLALALAAAVALLALRISGGRSSQIGFRRDRPGRALRLGVVTYLVLWPMLMGVALGKTVVLEWLGLEVPRQLAVETIVEQQSLHSDLQFLAGVIIVQPFLEEILYRGVLLAFLLRHLRPGAAIVVNSALFAAVHDAGRLEVFVLSLGLAWLYHRTRSLAAPTLLHALHNGLNILILVTYGDPLS